MSIAVRIAVVCLALHAVLSTFSAVAFSTFLSGAPPEWMQTPDAQLAMKLGWTFGPATTVVLGALAALLHAMDRVGSSRALMLLAVAFAVSLGAELLGTATGLPFGPYSYTPILGYKIGNLVPFNIPSSWFYMLYASLAIVARLLSATPRSEGQRWRWALAAGAVLTAWDVSMDPAMVKTSHWLWQLPAPESQSMIDRIFLSDLFYGMPLLNWIGWLVTGTVIARLMIAIVPADRWVERVAPSQFPLVLYAVNGILPLAICIRHGMTWATIFGSLAMAIPLILAVAKRPAPMMLRAPTPSPLHPSAG